jgi:hypothetical protein
LPKQRMRHFEATRLCRMPWTRARRSTSSDLRSGTPCCLQWTWSAKISVFWGWRIEKLGEGVKIASPYWGSEWLFRQSTKETSDASYNNINSVFFPLSVSLSNIFGISPSIYTFQNTDFAIRRLYFCHAEVGNSEKKTPLPSVEKARVFLEHRVVSNGPFSKTCMMKLKEVNGCRISLQAHKTNSIF